VGHFFLDDSESCIHLDSTLDLFKKKNLSNIRSKFVKKILEKTFSGAAYFCGTIVTTVGYGDTAPKTFEGRIAFMKRSSNIIDDFY